MMPITGKQGSQIPEPSQTAKVIYIVLVVMITGIVTNMRSTTAAKTCHAGVLSQTEGKKT